MTSLLHTPLKLGNHALAHRVVMAPLTRMRASSPGSAPHALNARYYGQRASRGGLIITEATQISWQGMGYPQTPGLHTNEQAVGWKDVVAAIHRKGAIAFSQLWHVGRISHSSHHPDGALPGLRLGAALQQFWWMRGYLAEGRQQYAALLALPAEQLFA